MQTMIATGLTLLGLILAGGASKDVSILATYIAPHSIVQSGHALGTGSSGEKMYAIPEERIFTSGGKEKKGKKK